MRYPQSDDGQYVIWSLWSRSRKGEPQGIYSHQTALSLFDLSDLMPAKLHMTVPSSFRRNVPIPDILVLHKGAISPTDIECRQGYRVARPLKAITDLLEEGAVSMDHLRQAAQQALAKGLITRSEIEAHPSASALN